MKKLVTHQNGFHADDVLAYAILKEVLTKQGETWTITRSRDYDVIAEADIAFDIGNEYDPARNRYDHHQKERAGARPNGVLYASAGLIWKHFGKELCSNTPVWETIDKALICELDAVDNGQNFVGELLFKEVTYTHLGMHIANFEPTMYEEKNPEILLDAFEKASEFARGVLVRMIHAVEAQEKAFQEASATYHGSEDKQILVFDKNFERPIWKRLAEYPEILYAVYPNEFAGTWKVECVPTKPTTLDSRKLFPESWRGLRDADLQAVTGLDDAQFCHPSGFLLGAVSKESAVKLAKMSLLM
jgi:uncharacterized UPF0160 family protein